MPRRARPAAALLSGLLLLLLGACAAQGPAAPAGTAGADAEAAFLHNYALLVCIAASYEALEPPAPGVVSLLEGEAWAFVEKGSAGAPVYERLHGLARAAGAAIPPGAAVRGCLRWHRGEALRGTVSRLLASPPAER